MAGQDNRHRIVPHGSADGSRRALLARVGLDCLRDITVGDKLAVGDFRKFSPYQLAKLRSTGRAWRNLARIATLEVRVEPRTRPHEHGIVGLFLRGGRKRRRVVFLTLEPQADERLAIACKLDIAQRRRVGAGEIHGPFFLSLVRALCRCCRTPRRDRHARGQRVSSLFRSGRVRHVRQGRLRTRLPLSFPLFHLWGGLLGLLVRHRPHRHHGVRSPWAPGLRQFLQLTRLHVGKRKFHAIVGGKERIGVIVGAHEYVLHRPVADAANAAEACSLRRKVGARTQRELARFHGARDGANGVRTLSDDADLAKAGGRIVRAKGLRQGECAGQFRYRSLCRRAELARDTPRERACRLHGDLLP